MMNLTLARTTFRHRPFVCHANDNWCEDGNVAALLGLADEAASDVLRAVDETHAASDPGWRFPMWHTGGGDARQNACISSVRLLSLRSMMPGLSTDCTNDDAAEHTPPDTALDAAAAQQARADLGVSGVAF